MPGRPEGDLSVELDLPEPGSSLHYWWQPVRFDTLALHPPARVLVMDGDIADAADVAEAAPHGNAPTTVSLSQDPYFSGDKNSDCTAERFIRNLDSLREINPNWSDARLIAFAMRHLKGPAEAYFLYAIKSSDRARMFTEYALFKTTFKKQFFAIACAVDVTTDWAKLSQNNSESSQAFFIRIASHIAAFKEYFPAFPALTHTDYPATPGLGTLLNPIADFGTRNLPGPENANARAELNALVLTAMREYAHLFAPAVRNTTLEQAKDDLTQKIFISGLKSSDLRDLAHSLARKGQDVYDIQTAVFSKERALAPRSFDNTPIKSHATPSLGRVSSIAMPSDGEGELAVSAIRTSRGGRGGGRGARGGRGGHARGSHTSAGTRNAPLYEPSAYTQGAKCNFCKKFNHTEDQCKRLQSAREHIKTSPSQTASKPFSLPPPSLHPTSHLPYAPPTAWDAAAINALPFTAFSGNAFPADSHST